MIEINFVNNSIVWMKDDVRILGINLFIDGYESEQWLRYAGRFGKRYADDILKDVIKAGLDELGGLASFDEEMEGQQ